MDEQERKAIALRRYAMIDDLVGVDLAYGEKSALLEELALAHGVSIPTLKRYLKRYEEKWFDGLLPKERSDAGTSRAIPPEALELAFRLRLELPSRSTPTIIRMLEKEREEWQGRIRRSTLDQHFQRAGLAGRSYAGNRRCAGSSPRLGGTCCGKRTSVSPGCGYGTTPGRNTRRWWWR